MPSSIVGGGILSLKGGRSMKRHQDIAIGIVILIFCAFFTYLSLQLESGSAMMPLILLGLMAFLGVIIFFDGLRKTRQATAEMPVGVSGGQSIPLSSNVEPFLTFENLRVPCLMFLQIGIYILLFFLVGYYAATALFLLAAMRWLKQKSWFTIIAVSACFIAFTYFFLVRQLNVSIDSLGWLGTYIQMQNVNV